MSYQRTQSPWGSPAYPPQAYAPSAPPPPYDSSLPPAQPLPGYSYIPNDTRNPYGGYQGYFGPGNLQPPPVQVYHCEHQHHYTHSDGCFSFLKGCLAMLCCCCLLEECCSI